MERPRIGRLGVGIALALAASLLAVPLFIAPPEEAGGSPQWDPPDWTSPPGNLGSDDPPAGPVDEPPAEGTYDAHLQVWAATGPLADEPHPIDDRFFATNIWESHGWYPERNETWTTMLAAIQPGALRWPAGHPGQETCFATEEGGPWPGCDHRVIPREQYDAFIELSREVDAEPVIAVNFKAAPPEMAAAMVEYLNVEKGYGVTYFYIGNEPDLGGDPTRVQWLIDDWSQYTSAMRAVDPNVKFVGPEIMTGVHVTGDSGRPDVLRPFLEKNGGDVDAISWHLYPLDSENRNPSSSAHPTIGHLLQYEAPDWTPAGIHFVDVASAKARADRDELAPGAEIWVTEIGPDSGLPGAPGITDAQVAAVWFADVLGRFAEQDTDVVMQFAYDHWDGDDELSLVQQPPYGDFSPLPPWYTYWLFAEHWGHGILKTNSSDDPRVSVHASVRDDGHVTAVLVNKGANATNARVTLNEFGSVAAADAYVLTAPEPTSLNATVNGKSIDPLRFDETASAITPQAGPASTDAVWELPPYSVTFVVFTPA